MQGRAFGSLLRGGTRDVASPTAAGSLRPATAAWAQLRALSTTPSLRSPDDDGADSSSAGSGGSRQPSNPRERSRAAAESLAGLSGGNNSAQTPLSQRINRQFAAPINVRSLPRRPLEHPGENDKAFANSSGGGGGGGGGGPNGPPRFVRPPGSFVRPPSSFASRGGIVKAPGTLGRGRGDGTVGARPAGLPRLGGSNDFIRGSNDIVPGGGSSFGAPRTGGTGGRGGRERRPRGGKRGGKKDDDSGYKKEKRPGVGDSAEEKEWLAARERGERIPYVPSATAESLAGWGPAVPSSAGSRGMVESAMRAMRVLGGGQPFEPGWNNDPIDNTERYEAGQPVFFADPAERQWLVENSDLEQIHIASKETQDAIVNAALQGKIAATPQHVPLGGSDPMATVNMYLARQGTYRTAEAKAFAEKFASLLPGAPKGGAGNAVPAPKQARA